MLHSIKFPQHCLQKLYYVVPNLRDLEILILHPPSSRDYVSFCASRVRTAPKGRRQAAVAGTFTFLWHRRYRQPGSYRLRV